MERILKESIATLAVTFQVDGVATDPSPATATIEIIRADGTVLVAAGTATTRTGVGTFQYLLTTTHTGLLDVLTARWTSSLGTITSTVEVVGGFLFTIADARAVKPLDNTTTYTTAKIVAARTLAEQALEDACGVAFVPRYTRERITGYGTSTTLLRPKIRAVRSASVDGVALSAGELADLRLLPTGEVYNANRWSGGFGGVEVAYEHGFDSPPLRVSRAALILAKNWLTVGPIDDRATSINTEDGFIALSTPGLRGAYTGLPEVDAVIREYSYRVAIA